jgi:outer membrane protein assembly factor BamD
MQGDRRRALPALGAAALAALCGCWAATSADSVDITKPVVGEAATNAEKAYRRGEAERKSSNYLEATKYYEWVKNNFPYSQYSALSELALADMAFDRDDFDTSAKAYEEFVKSHPSHPMADFASYRVGLSRYNDKASDNFILPPSYEREQAPVRNALDAFNRFLAAYPTSKYAPEARSRIIDCRARLARHERFVAEFYWKRGAWQGSAGRFMALGQTYGDLDDGKLRGEAFWRAGEAFRKAGDPINERVALQRLLAQAPQGPYRAEAERRLKEIPAVPPAALGVEPKTATPPTGAPAPAPPKEGPAAEPPPKAPAPPQPVGPPGPPPSGGPTPTVPR